MAEKSHRKRRLLISDENAELEEEEEDIYYYKFRILLPNGTTVGLTLRDPEEQMEVDEFVAEVRREYNRSVKEVEVSRSKRKIMWWSGSRYLEDENDNKISKRISFRRFKPYKCHLLKFHDGEEEACHSFEVCGSVRESCGHGKFKSTNPCPLEPDYRNMWDLTPDTDLLKELPEEYTYETALADLIDNSLQAIWSNAPNERRLISLTVAENMITIFDTGPGMDGTEENSIVKWGKMGSSLHRPFKRQAIGGKPPYLRPFFGMFGYGGPIASMHLGRRAVVSSKRKESKKVYTLDLEREALLRSSGEMTWKTAGGLRDPLEDESKLSPHGSFTKVQIFDPKMTCLDEVQLMSKLKDIYFPYIQCDEEFGTGKTTTPVEFQVNGQDLAEVEGGEVAVTNLHSCNGPEFVVQLCFTMDQNISSTPGSREIREANARLKFSYFPIVDGKESIDKILEKLGDEGCAGAENFDTFSRVSIRRLGRLLPDAHWNKLSMVIVVAAETDAGFSPTPSKTDLAYQNPFTKALRNFGKEPNEKGITTDICRGGKPLSLLQLEKEYQDWVIQMHDKYDEEIVCGEDQPVLVLNPSDKKGLGVSSDVLRVHKVIRRKGTSWKSGQKIKIHKGAAGCYKQNLYATLEYIILEGFQGDAGGGARLICRVLGLPAERGCVLSVKDGNPCLDIQESLSFPISVIDSGKCSVMDATEWKYQLEKLHQKAPSKIDVLSRQQCQQLGIDGGLPVDAPVCAGHVTPKEVVAVVRPASFTSSSASTSLDQKFIVKNNFQMLMEVKYLQHDNDDQDPKNVYSGWTKPASHKGFNGLYIFPLGSRDAHIFNRAGVYKFSFLVESYSQDKKWDVRVHVKPSSRVGKWRLECDKQRSPYSVRVGSCLPPIRISCFDIYGNHMPFPSIPDLQIKMNVEGYVHVENMKVEVCSSQMILEISDLLIESRELDKIRPDYEASMEIKCSQDNLLSVMVPCKVFPGTLRRVQDCSPRLENNLRPGDVIEEIWLEMFDAYDNHVNKGVEVYLRLDGFRIQNSSSGKLEVDSEGCFKLSGILKVTGSYGENVSFSVEYDGNTIFKKSYLVEQRELRVVSKVPTYCVAGSQLENLAFEIINSDGTIDETIHDDAKFGQSHTLVLTSKPSKIDDSSQYSFYRGRCNVPVVSIPREPGICTLTAAHSRHPKLCTNMQILVTQTPKKEMIGLAEFESLQFQSPGVGSFLQNLCPRVSQHVEGIVQTRSPSSGSLLQNLSPPVPQQVERIVQSFVKDVNELEDDVTQCGERIANNEKAMGDLQEQKESISQEITDLLALVQPQSVCSQTEKDELVKHIAEKGDTAASIYCELSLALQSPESQSNLMQDIVGIVALLGTVSSRELSRMLAEYLGEDYMLAFVCKSYKAAQALERYGDNGLVASEHTLHEVAKELGKSISGRFHVMCLENTRPYVGQVKDNDPQHKLALPDPVLPSGEFPTGFLGYAVNMVDIDNDHLDTRTSKGQGLRETLFYRLFGELHVYETRKHMLEAYADLKQAAISLDGGILRGDGVLSLGYREPEVCFPVIKYRISPETTCILARIEEKKSELAITNDKIWKAKKVQRKLLKKYDKKKERFSKFMEEKEPLLSGNALEYKLE